ncbi:hypothetical protein [Mycobacterium leprae]|nr:hypothetical protein [Mycobacterium leprae]
MGSEESVSTTLALVIVANGFLSSYVIHKFVTNVTPVKRDVLAMV